MRSLLPLLLLLPLLWLAPGGQVAAAAPPEFELSAAPAWAGWSRPGRATEIDIRLRSSVAARVTVDVTAGRQLLRAQLDLQPGRAARLQLPVPAAQTVRVQATMAGSPVLRRETTVALSESPVLGVGVGVGLGLTGSGLTALPGFHTVALGADDLPRHASAYSSIDALVLDARTLAALDGPQLEALLEHAAACGRVVVIDPDARLQRVLEGAGRCGGRTLVTAASLAQGLAALQTSLATRLPAALAPADLAGLAPPGQPTWRRLAVALAACFAAMFLAAIMSRSLPVLVLTPALAAAALLGLIHLMPPPAQVLVWSEGESGEPVARYQARQLFSGLAREWVRLPVPPQLAAAARPCDATQAMTLDFDTGATQVAFVEFESRLFRQSALCFSGSFPLARAMAAQARPDGAHTVLNTGSKAWPPGTLLAGGRVHDLPALGPGESATVEARAGRAPRGALARTALARTAPDAVAALWSLDLAGVAQLPAGARGWLLVAERTP